jgi:hypothetical protein
MTGRASRAHNLQRKGVGRRRCGGSPRRGRLTVGGTTRGSSGEGGVAPLARGAAPRRGLPSWPCSRGKGEAGESRRWQPLGSETWEVAGSPLPKGIMAGEGD